MPRSITQEGPCIQVKWRLPQRGATVMVAHYFPVRGRSLAASEMDCVEWFCRRQGLVLEVDWCWGLIPGEVTKTRRVVLG